MPTKTHTTESANTPLASCVADPDRDYACAIVDSAWSSPEARAQHMLPLAQAQRGTAGTDRAAWEARVLEGTIRRVLPLALHAAARVHPDALIRAMLLAAADRCASDGTREAAGFAAYATYANATDAAKDTDAYTVYAAYAAVANAVSAAYAAKTAKAVAYAVYAVYAVVGDDSDLLLTTAVSVALNAYAAEGRQ